MRHLMWFFVLVPSIARAECQCPESNARDLLDSATLVFNGRVEDMQIHPKTERKTIYFDVTEIFKGTPRSEVAVHETSEPDCVIPFKENENYMVYARWQWGEFLTSRCFGTKRLEAALPDAKVLGPGDEAKAKMYKRLRDACLGGYAVKCCLESVKTMQAGGYLTEPDGGCPEGMIPDRLRCERSYTWCIPIPEADQRRSAPKGPASRPFTPAELERDLNR